MNTHTEVVSARLTLDVTYLLNGEAAPEMLARLQRMCERAIGEGLLTGDTAAEVDTWSSNVAMVPSTADSDVLEAEIATFMQQRIEDGNLDAKHVSMWLARYGLMMPEAFIAEMRERMNLDEDEKAEGLATASASLPPMHHGKFEMPVAVACVNASGSPVMPVFTVRITREEYDLGIHYDKAEDLAEEAGYEGPFICLDTAEQGAILSAAHQLGLVPQVVVVDMTDGQIHSIRCDSGEIKVICYDTSDTDEYSEAVSDRPFGESGQLVRCWSHTQLAQVDPGLKLARD